MTLAFALVLTLAASPEVPNAAPGFERGARSRAADPSIDDERRGDAMLVGAAVGAGAGVAATIGLAAILQLEADATPPERRNPDAHVTPLLFAMFTAPIAAVLGAGLGAGLGLGVAALQEGKPQERDAE